MLDWSGIFHILATPFRADGSLDGEGLPHLGEPVLGTGVSGLTVLGIAGEAHRLTDEERRAVVRSRGRDAAPGQGRGGDGPGDDAGALPRAAGGRDPGRGGAQARGGADAAEDLAAARAPRAARGDLRRARGRVLLRGA